MSVVSQLLAAAAATINDTPTTPPLTAVIDYAATIKVENCGDMAVVLFPLQSESVVPTTLSGANTVSLEFVLELHSLLKSPVDSTEVENLLDVREMLVARIESGLSPRTYIRQPRDAQPIYDVDRLREEGYFASATVFRYEAPRR